MPFRQEKVSRAEDFTKIWDKRLRKEEQRK